MEERHFSFVSSDGTNIHVHHWCLPDVQSKGIVQVLHGMSEHSYRYKALAEVLCKHGYEVYAHDHRGHGRSVKDPTGFGYLGNNGFMMMVEDAHQLSMIIKSTAPHLPLILMGHSMGSFVAQRYFEEYGNELNGLILSGSSGRPAPGITAGIVLARLQMLLMGDKAKSTLIDKLSFGTFNKSFKPNRTISDWLSRDQEQVDKYLNDPLCGFICSASFYYDFYRGIKSIHKRENLTKIPQNVPVLIFSGDNDPVGEMGKGVHLLNILYKNSGVQHLTCQLYKGGRHEMLNEINREEVLNNLINWLGQIG